MRKTIILLACFCIAGYTSHAQLSEGGIPYSLKTPQLKTTENIETFKLKKLRTEKLLKEDQKQKKSNRYSIYQNVDIDIKKEGTSSVISEGVLYKYTIVSENGYSIGLYFKNYKLPAGARLFIYNPDYSTIYGAFTHKNNKEHGTLTIADFPGKTLVIEYFEPSNSEFPGTLILGKIGQSYKDISGLSFKSTLAGEDIDINCPEGDLVQLQKHAVAKMTFVENGSGYLCTGALVNNTQNDGKPYFLTARHCLSTTVVASTLVTYFNFENKDCNGLSFAGSSLSGATLKASYKGSDFTLLLLDETPTAAYQPYFAGWNAASDSVVKSGTGIHHPAGTQKKVALEYDHIISFPEITTWDNNTTAPANSHWYLIFDKGFTEPGSSGSPLFDENNRIIGQLHGGSSPSDLYGKFSYSWATNAFSNAQLKYWLDPFNTGVKVLNGYYPLTNLVDAHFTTKFNSVCTGEPVYLKDGSLFSPNSWLWTFTPATVSFLESTDQTSQNPVVVFQTDGKYDITLVAGKGAETNLQTKRDYIIAGDTLNLSIIAQNTGTLCFNNFTKTTLYSMGADTGYWTIVSETPFLVIDTLNSNADSLVLVKNDTMVIDTSYVVTVQFTGIHGACSDSVTVDLNVVYPFNDDIEDAHTLALGNNGPFTNSCATTQTNEPNPTGGDCNSQNAWCECEISENLLDNSVWFKFVAPTSGVVAIDVPGFDNQVALYKASSVENILSDDPELYGIVAANDDYYSEDDDYASLIKHAVVTPGETYWVQVDGSACGTDGTFEINLYDTTYNPLNGINVIEKTISNPLVVYPNPASTYFTFENGNHSGDLNVTITSLDGKKVYETTVTSETDSQYKVSLTESIINGLYIVTVTDDKTSYNAKLSVQR